MESLEAVSAAWETLTSTFGDLTQCSDINQNLLKNSRELLSCLNILCDNNLDVTFIDWYFDEIREYLNQEIVLPFRTRSHEILLFHHKQLRTQQFGSDGSMRHGKSERKHKQKRGHRSRAEIDANPNDPTPLMTASCFDIDLWNDLLGKIEEMIKDVSYEIACMKNIVWQLSTLLNALYSTRFAAARNNSMMHSMYGMDANISNISDISTVPGMGGIGGIGGIGGMSGMGGNGMEKNSIGKMQDLEKREKERKMAAMDGKRQKAVAPPSDTLQELNKRLQSMIHSIFFSTESGEFDTLFRIMFEYALIHFSMLHQRWNMVKKDEYVVKFGHVCFKLNELHWLPVLEPIFVEVGYKYIEVELETNYQVVGNKANTRKRHDLLTQPRMLDTFEKWSKEVVLQWLKMIMIHEAPSINMAILEANQSSSESIGSIGSNASESDVGDNDITMSNTGPRPKTKSKTKKSDEDEETNWMDSKILLPWKVKIDKFVFEKFGQMRTKEMFEIILTFPDSMPALLDLKTCLNKDFSYRSNESNHNMNESNSSNSSKSNKNNVASSNRHFWRKLQLTLLKSLKQRLLHPGVRTKDIISNYISTIKALRILDPKGTTLEIVGDPIRTYLRGREDAMRCVADTLIENDTALLREYKAGLVTSDAGEMNGYTGQKSNQRNGKRRGRSRRHRDANHEWTEWEQRQSQTSGTGQMYSNESLSDASDAENGDAWEPASLDSDLVTNQKSFFKRECDIAAMLVKIFGSRELFITQYKLLLANRLITMPGMILRSNLSNTANNGNNGNNENKKQMDGKGSKLDIYEIEKELEYLELMKMRFGDECLHECEVMINDVINSKREFSNLRHKVKMKIYNDYLAATGAKGKKGKKGRDEEMARAGGIADMFDAVLVSCNYWPEMKHFDTEKYNFEPPNTMTKLLFDTYEKQFDLMTQTRYLQFCPFYGCVELDLELNGTMVQLNVLPLQAAIITHMQELLSGENGASHESVGIGMICKNLKISQSQALESIAFWERKGIVIQNNGNYRLADGRYEEGVALRRLMQQKEMGTNGSNGANGSYGMMTSMEEMPWMANDMDKGEDREVIEQEFEKNVLGTITQYNGKSREQIYGLLKQLKLHPMFATLKIEELQKVLDGLVSKNKISCNDGTYFKNQVSVM